MLLANMENVKMKNISYLALILTLTMMLPGPAFSGGGNDFNHFKVYKIVIDERYHHIGDGFRTDYIIKENEGRFWASSFKVPKKLLVRKEVAYIKFRCHLLDDTDLIVNGYRISLNESNERPFEQHFVNYVVPLDIDILHPGENTISFEVNELEGGGLDDMEFGELEIWFQ